MLGDHCFPKTVSGWTGGEGRGERGGGHAPYFRLDSSGDHPVSRHSVILQEDLGIKTWGMHTQQD